MKVVQHIPPILDVLGMPTELEWYGEEFEQLNTEYQCIQERIRLCSSVEDFLEVGSRYTPRVQEIVNRLQQVNRMRLYVYEEMQKQSTVYNN